MSESSVLEGVAPAFCWVPDRASSAGAEALDLAAQSGIRLDPEQRLAIDAILSEDSRGKWTALEAAVIEPRQNGKTGGIILPIVLADVYVIGTGLIVWTSHRFKTSQESFRELKGVIEANPDLDRRVAKIREANGEEGIEFLNGSRVDFLARSRGAGRGLSGDRVILDEAFDLDADAMGSLFPTLSARPNPQVVYGSSAGQARSDVLRSVRDRGRKGGDPALVYLEWCAPEDSCLLGAACTHGLDAVGCALDREDFWQLANPALGKRITVEFIRAERRALPPAEFARERMGWWDEPVGGLQPISLPAWAALAVDLDAVDRTLPPMFFLDASPQMRSASITAALPGEKPHAELAAFDPGTHWLVGRAAQLKNRHEGARWFAWAGGAIGALLPELAEQGIEPELFTISDMGRGCAHLQKLVAEQGFTHSGDPLFTAALAGAVKRDVGEGLWVWGWRKSTADISPLYGITGALWALELYGADYDVLDSVL